MAKKLKNKGKNPRKPNNDPPVPPPADPPSQTDEIDPAAAATATATESCAHYGTGDGFVWLARRIGDLDRCEDCRGDDPGRRPPKGKGKQGKKKSAAAAEEEQKPKLIWVCTSCGHASCGGTADLDAPYGHARRHSKLSRHACAVRSDDPRLCFCFECQSTVFAPPPPPPPPRPPPSKPAHAEDVGPGHVVRGLANLGNTCFFNSVIQNVLALDPLRGHFGGLERLPGKLTASLKKLFEDTGPLRSESGKALRPNGVFGCVRENWPQFRGFQQQDSHELLMCLLDGLSAEDANSEVKKTYVDSIFGGEVSTTVWCLNCGHSSTVYEPFLDLSLPVPGKKGPHIRAVEVASPKKARKGRQKGKTTCVAVEKEGSGSTCAKAEGSDSNCAVDGGAPSVETEVKDEDLWWLDWVESIQMEEGLDEVSCAPSNGGVAVSQGSGNGDVTQNESTSEEVGTELKSITSALDCIEGSSSDMGNNMALDSTSTKDGVEGSSAVSGCEQAEGEDFEGLGDLFNEPEMTSGLKLESKECSEESDYCESTQEVDDMNSPVSVENCLAVFTQAELLSEEQMWHCENCSKSLQGQLVPTVERGEDSTGLKLQSTEGNTQFNDLGNGGLENDASSTANSDGLASGVERVNHEKSSSVGGFENERLGVDESKSESESNKRQCLCTLGLDNIGSQVNLGVRDVEKKSEQVNSGTNEGCKECDKCLVDAPGNLVDPDETVPKGGNTTLKSDKVPQGGSQLPHKVYESEGEGDKEIIKVMRDATLRVLIKKAPRVLIIHLKRFSNDGRRLRKLNGHVVFRELLELGPYMDPRKDAKSRGLINQVGGKELEVRKSSNVTSWVCEEKDSCLYHLTGVVEHSGMMRGGHYVAYVKGDKLRGKGDSAGVSSTWFYASDSLVREVTLTEVLKAEAYILFFERIQN
ncbi:Ubiquitin carboxyl-terminal hydrolase 2 [Acorus calamus]|uniref:Ubiquitin carboxyl-terminal hydrolase n=1 Tax=Acorus calamus TaxID=4465 RepID=A0AAV9D1S2_ACOCL|nr:Ubiquitin carboxyl-terminal hydrolase 2 [Acorus calamus]